MNEQGCKSKWRWKRVKVKLKGKSFKTPLPYLSKKKFRQKEEEKNLLDSRNGIQEEKERNEQQSKSETISREGVDNAAATDPPPSKMLASPQNNPVIIAPNDTNMTWESEQQANSIPPGDTVEIKYAREKPRNNNNNNNNRRRRKNNNEQRAKLSASQPNLEAVQKDPKPHQPFRKARGGNKKGARNSRIGLGPGSDLSKSLPELGQNKPHLQLLSELQRNLVRRKNHDRRTKGAYRSYIRYTNFSRLSFDGKERNQKILSYLIMLKVRQ